MTKKTVRERHCTRPPLFISALRASFACSGLISAACSDAGMIYEDTSGQYDELGALEQPFSIDACAEASPDKILDISSASFNLTHTTPDLYNNPNSYLSYIWELRANATSAAHINSVNYRVTLHQTANGAFRPAHADTPAECRGLRLRTNVFYDGELLRSQTDRGVWDANGCYLPHETPPIEIPSTLGSRVRVCATARHADNESVIPMTLVAHGTLVEDQLNVIDAPRVPFTVPQPGGPSITIWERVSKDAASANAYCVGHGFTSGFGGNAGACTLVVAKYNPQSLTWTQVSGGCQQWWSSLICQ